MTRELPFPDTDWSFVHPPNNWFFCIYRENLCSYLLVRLMIRCVTVTLMRHKICSQEMICSGSPLSQQLPIWRRRSFSAILSSALGTSFFFPSMSRHPLSLAIHHDSLRTIPPKHESLKIKDMSQRSKEMPIMASLFPSLPFIIYQQLISLQQQ